MAQQTIDIGAAPNDGTGDPIRDAFDKCNDNFTELYGSLAGLLDFQGATDCSANPNYPAASQGDIYIVSVAGKIGGASGKVVEVGDFYLALADNAGGTEASVGTSWAVLQANIAGGAVVTELDDVPDVNAPAPSNGDVLTWDSTPGEWVAAPPSAGIAELDDVPDVNAPTPSDGDVLTWDSTPGEWVAAAPTGGSNALDDLTDVDTTGVSDGDVLTYDSGSWVPAAPSGGSAWGGWTELTFGSTSTVLGMTNCNVANETLTAANGDRIEIEAEVEKAINTDGACGIRVGSEGYYLKAQQDNNLVSYRYDGGSEVAFNATGNSIPNDYSGVYTYKLVVNVDSALSNILYGMINDLRFPTTSHTSDSNVNCTGTVEFFVRGSAINRVRARIIT